MLVIQDYLTKWPEVYALPDRRAEMVAKCLQEALYMTELQSFWQRYYRKLLTTGDNTVANLRGQANGGKTSCWGYNWDFMLGPVLFSHWTTLCCSTGLTPFYLLYGRNPSYLHHWI